MFCDRLKSLREAYNYTQVQVASKVGVKKQSVANWEKDNILPSIEKLIRVSELFHVPTDYLLGLDDHHYIDVSGLPLEVSAHLQLLINDLINKDKFEDKKSQEKSQLLIEGIKSPI